MRHAAFIVAVVMEVAFAPGTLAGQIMAPGGTAGPPTISVTGTGEVTLAPDRAVMRFSIQGLGPSAADASAQITQRVTAITDTLRRRGLSADSIQQMGLFVGPNAELVGQFRRPTDYSARTEIRVTVRKLADLPGIIEAALVAGAMELAGIQYFSDHADEGNREALRQAFAKARTTAEALAGAAGRRLGELSWMSTTTSPNFGYVDQYTESVFMSSGRPMRIASREVIIRASVQALWRLEPR